MIYISFANYAENLYNFEINKFSIIFFLFWFKKKSKNFESVMYS